MTHFVAQGIVALVGDGPPGRRLGSRCIDLAVAAFVWAGIGGGGIALLGEDTGDATFSIGAAAAVPVIVAAYFASVAVVALLDLGRRAFGLRLVRVDGTGGGVSHPPGP